VPSSQQTQPAEIIELMLHLVRHARRSASTELSGLPVTPAQARVIEVIRRAGGPLRVNELAGELGILPRSATSAADDLEELGLVTRGPDRRDRRAVLVTLTKQGRRVARQLRSKSSGAVAKAIRDLPQDDQDMLERILRQLATSLD
jgi:DNA-binding MarR family transcriptional regulator